MSRSSSFIRKSTRLAIYFRDKFTCIWCGVPVTSDTASLDHLDPNGGHSAKNLVTACTWCNSTRQAKSLSEWYKFLRNENPPRSDRNVRSRVHRARHKLINQELGRFAARTALAVEYLAAFGGKVPF